MNQFMKIHVHPKSPLLLGVFTVTSNLLPGEPNLLVEHGGEDHLQVHPEGIVLQVI